MRLWRVRTNRKIAPFGDTVTQAFMFPNTVGQAQEQVCQQRGMDIDDVLGQFPFELGPGLVLFDDSYVNPPALEYFVQHTKAPGTAALCLLPDDPLGQFVLPLANATPLGSDGARAIGLFIVDHRIQADSADHLWQMLCAEARPVVLPPCGASQERLPAFPQHQPTLTIPRAQMIAAKVRRWYHLLWLNQVVAYSADQRSSDRNQISPDARVHKTAYLENAVVEADSTIEPNVTLIDSRVGSGCHIADHSVLIGCTIGDNCQTLTDTYLKRVASFPGATISSMGLEEVLVGRNVFLTSAAIFYPTVYGESARVEEGDSWVDTGKPRLGGCVGHNAVLGTRAIFDPARVVENGYTIVMRPEEGVAKIDPRLANGDPACWDRGRLVPVAEVAPNYTPPEIDESR